MAGLDSLSPSRRAQYESLVPEIQRKARSASQARGMFYSGDAIDAETRAEADLLAKLAGEDASDIQQSSENEKSRQLEREQSDKALAATKRGQLLGIVGTGLGAAGTLAGLKYMNPGGGKNIVSVGGNLFSIDANGKATQIALPGQVGGAALAPAAAPGAGVGSLDALSGTPGLPQSSVPFTPGAGPGMAPAAAPGVAGAAPQPTMWTKAGAAAAGAGGGFLGNVLARKIGGGGGLATDVGSGVGGLGGLIAGYKMSGGNPWIAGLSALAGSTGGGLIGNLFR